MAIQITQGATIVVIVVFKNIGPSLISDTRWRIGIGRGHGVFPIITDWILTGPVAPYGAQGTAVTVYPQGKMPGDWGEGELIGVALDVEVLDSEGNVLDSQKPIRVWEDYFVIITPGVDWIGIISAEPYVAE